MKIKVFIKEGCPKCPPAKELAEDLANKGIKVEFFDMDTPDGLAEASMFNVMATPTIIIINDEDKEEKAYRGVVPQAEEIIRGS